MIKMIMHGCNGKMGQVITDICKEDSEIEIVAGVDPYSGVKMTIRYLQILENVMWMRMWLWILRLQQQWTDCWTIV